ncbi:alpha/beta fold hydrolase [Streptomyces sp. DSM 42041]|uniref:Alpha/beta fold hydrolase n=1 Tax=Streptomyces hazeniae TaxID=3075538 RepID=A0ABU2NVJ0_9ACTN|nr:alpha/beta fold hydrolase [Streptomyces sp. DSM 42041]MDT0380542.1 alpha/beta fold hydrolase [Streptomyces sp. DSM 42041]
MPSRRNAVGRLAAAVAATLALTAALHVPGASAATPDAGAVEGGWNDFSCEPSPEHPRPVVLVHGTFANSADNWFALAPHLVERGYCVFALDYGRVPGVPLFHGVGPVAASARELSAYVERVLKATGATEVDLVGHSQGATMPRHYVQFLGGAAEVGAFVGIAPPNDGLRPGGVDALLDLFPRARQVFDGTVPALADLRAGSEFMERLNAGGDTVPGVRYTVIATRHDQVVTPHTSSFLEGPNVHNVLVQDLCPLDVSEHLAVGTVDRVTFHEVTNALDPEHATPTTCFS